MDYEKKYNEALERAKELIAKWTGKNKDFYVEDYAYIFPELRESEDEDERMIRKIKSFLSAYDAYYFRNDEWREIEVWLEKQKEQKKEELVYRLNGLMQEYINEAKDQDEEEHRFKCYKLFWNALEDTSYFEQKEQKPVDDSDFKTKLAEYMTKNRTGGSYSISSESILELAKEELLKRGELKKPKPAWSEEDKSILEALLYDIERLPMQGVLTHRPCDSYIKFLKALRPGWKPTEEQMDALQRAIDACESEWDYQDDELRSLLDDLKKL